MTNNVMQCLGAMLDLWLVNFPRTLPEDGLNQVMTNWICKPNMNLYLSPFSQVAFPWVYLQWRWTSLTYIGAKMEIVNC